MSAGGGGTGAAVAGALARGGVTGAGSGALLTVGAGARDSVEDAAAGSGGGAGATSGAVAGGGVTGGDAGAVGAGFRAPPDRGGATGVVGTSTLPGA